MVNEHFLPSREPFATGMLPVDDLHTLYAVWTEAAQQYRAAYPLRSR